jgi:hypothetical protein
VPIRTDWVLELQVDQVLRGQGADPAIVRARRPQLVEVATRALSEGQGLLSPRVLHEAYRVERLRHERLTLAGGGTLSGVLIARHLASAEQVVVVVCSVGSELEETVARWAPEDPVYAMALDGLGSAATEALAAAAAHSFETLAAVDGLQTTVPLSPGMEGWPVEQGQTEIFSLCDVAQAGISLTQAGMMIPLKSVSFVIGIGRDVATGARACDLCTLRQTCRYQNHYA